MQRAKYAPEFKDEAVKQVIDKGHTVVYVTLPFLVIYLGKQTSRVANFVHASIGDPSYGIYLYAFPLQQFIIYWFRPSTLMLFVASTIGAFIFGYLSWILIEKKALALKQYFLERRQPVK